MNYPVAGKPGAGLSGSDADIHFEVG